MRARCFLSLLGDHHALWGMLYHLKSATGNQRYPILPNNCPEAKGLSDMLFEYFYSSKVRLSFPREKSKITKSMTRVLLTMVLESYIL